MKATHILVAAAISASTAVFAQQAPAADGHASHHSSPAGKPESEAEVRKVDLAQGKVTLRHGPITSLDMPAMTMVFTAQDKKLLDGLQAGDKVRFSAAKKDGLYIVTAIEAAK